ncbi:UNVERIFIED_CONTAM: hypothetical protein FKN15_044093 [Acipenser sinensis]
MGKTSKDRIIDTLGDLDDNGLNWFKDKLGDTSFQGRKIGKGELQDANIVTVACLLMSTYTETHAAENAIAVLNDINQVQLANQLKEKIKDLLLQAEEVCRGYASSSLEDAGAEPRHKLTTAVSAVYTFFYELNTIKDSFGVPRCAEN